MSNTYNSRRGLNVSAYLQNLNALSPIEEPIDQQYNPADDLSLWTDTTFFDFDMGAPITHDPSADVKHTKPVVSVPETVPQPHQETGFQDFMNDFKEFETFDYSPEFTGFAEQQQPQPTLLPQPADPQAISIPHSPLAAAYPPQQPAPVTTPIAAPSPAKSAGRGAKRKASLIDGSSPQATSLEEASRLAAEEDKRRRNTAASARFRIKKKQKEQQLEKTAKEMTDRVATLEARIQTLEMENKWLKNLIVEKNGGKSGEEIMIPPSIFEQSKLDGAGSPAEIKTEIAVPSQ